jgi:putative oxidoreductase
MNASSISEYFKKPETGLLLLRVCVGATMIMHGLPKFFGGAAVLTSVGQAVSVYGVTQYPLAWGFAAASVEVFGGLLIMLGLLFRCASFALSCLLFTALLSLKPQVTFEAFGGYAHAFVMLSVFVSFILIGPGAYSFSGGSKGGSKGASKGAKAAGKSKGEE